MREDTEYVAWASHMSRMRLRSTEDARRLARYDEAIRLLEDWRKFGDLETNEMPYGDTAAFLAAEGKVAG